MITRLYSAAAVLSDASLLTPACITIDNGIIVDVTSELPGKNSSENIIELGHNLLMPGFVNARACQR